MQLVNAFHDTCEFGSKGKKISLKLRGRYRNIVSGNITNETVNAQDSSSEVL